MNKQKERLISADKLLEWLEDKFRNYPQERMGDYGAGQDALDMVATAVENGTFDPDPIPLPTLYKCNECGEVSTAHEWNYSTLEVYGDDIYSIDDPEAKGQSAYFICPKCKQKQPLEILTVVEDKEDE